MHLKDNNNGNCRLIILKYKGENITIFDNLRWLNLKSKNLGVNWWFLITCLPHSVSTWHHRYSPQGRLNLGLKPPPTNRWKSWTKYIQKYIVNNSFADSLWFLIYLNYLRIHVFSSVIIADIYFSYIFLKNKCQAPVTLVSVHYVLN